MNLVRKLCGVKVSLLGEEPSKEKLGSKEKKVL
jgi:hypothetical protein